MMIGMQVLAAPCSTKHLKVPKHSYMGRDRDRTKNMTMHHRFLLQRHTHLTQLKSILNRYTQKGHTSTTNCHADRVGYGCTCSPHHPPQTRGVLKLTSFSSPYSATILLMLRVRCVST